MTNRPFITIVIPCYKQAHLLHEAVESVLEQTFADWEIIIVNDGSPDGTSEAAQALIQTHPARRIKLIEQENGGLSHARNEGIRASTTEWVLPLDSDDKFHPTYIEKIAQAIKDNPGCNVVSCHVQRFGADNESWITARYSLGMLKQQNVFPYASAFRRVLWERTGGYERGLPWGAEDLCFWLACGKLGIHAVQLNEKLFLYRIQPETMFTELMKHWSYALPMIHTVHPDVFSVTELMAAHQKITELEQKTADVLKNRLLRFPELSLPHLWLGLSYEKQQRFEQAEAEYHSFIRLHYCPDWQPYWRLIMLYINWQRTDKASETYQIVRQIMPHAVWMDKCLLEAANQPPAAT